MLLKLNHSLGIVYKQANNIIRVEAFSNYSKIYCNDEKHPIMVAKVLKWFELQLPNSEFIRIHRSHLINKNYLSTCKLNNVILSNGEIFNISRRRKNVIPLIIA